MVDQATIDRVAAAIDSADIGFSMRLIRLVDGVNTYTLTIDGMPTEEFTDNDDGSATDQLYARVREVKQRKQAEAVIASLTPSPQTNKIGDDDASETKQRLIERVLRARSALEGMTLTSEQEEAIAGAFDAASEVIEAVLSNMAAPPENHADLPIIKSVCQHCQRITVVPAATIKAAMQPPENHADGYAGLEALAKAAMQGPHHIYTHARDDNNWKANAAFHEAASPQIILDLIATVRTNLPPEAHMRRYALVFDSSEGWDMVADPDGEYVKFADLPTSTQTLVCSECHGTGEIFGHADDCHDDLCALNGDMHSCTGKVEPCGCTAPPENRVDDIDRCPICAEPFTPDDICATDIEMGTVHAECLDGCEIVDLETGEPTDKPLSTYRYSEVMEPAPPQTNAKEEA